MNRKIGTLLVAIAAAYAISSEAQQPYIQGENQIKFVNGKEVSDSKQQIDFEKTKNFAAYDEIMKNIYPHPKYEDEGIYLVQRSSVSAQTLNFMDAMYKEKRRFQREGSDSPIFIMFGEFDDMKADAEVNFRAACKTLGISEKNQKEMINTAKSWYGGAKLDGAETNPDKLNMMNPEKVDYILMLHDLIKNPEQIAEWNKTINKQDKGLEKVF